MADRYWNVRDHPQGRNIAWSYSAPFAAVAKVAGRVAFYNELVGISVDAVLLTRPDSPFSAAASRPGG